MLVYLLWVNRDRNKQWRIQKLLLTGVVHRKGRQNSFGGGAYWQVKDDYTFTVCNDLMFDDIESSWEELKLDSISLLNV